MKLYEFTGMPGSGKTTLYKESINIIKKYDNLIMDKTSARFFALRNELNSSISGKLLKFYPRILWGSKVNSLETKHDINSKYKIEYKEKNKKFVSDIINLQNQRLISNTHKEAIIDWFLGTCGLYQNLERNLDSGISVLMDSGFIQNTISLFHSLEEDVNLDMLSYYLKKIPKVKLIISVNANVNTCCKRITNRGLPRRMEGLNSYEMVAYLRKVKDLIDIVLKKYKSYNDVTIIKVQNNGDIKDSLNFIDNEFSKYFKI